MELNSGMKIQSIKWHKIDVDKPETWPDEDKSVILNVNDNSAYYIIIRKGAKWHSYGFYGQFSECDIENGDIWAEIPTPPDWLIKGKKSCKS